MEWVGTKPEDFHFDKQPRAYYPPLRKHCRSRPLGGQSFRRKGQFGRNRREAAELVGGEQEKGGKEGFSVWKRGPLPLSQEGRRGVPKRNMRKDSETSPGAGKETQELS